MWVDSSGMPYCGNETRLGSIIYILTTNNLFQRITNLLSHLFFCNLAPKLLVPRPNPSDPPEPAAAAGGQLGLWHLGDVLAGRCNLGLQGCQQPRGQAWVITHTVQFWVFSSLSESPHGLSLITHDSDLHTDLPWLAVLSSLRHSPSLTRASWNHLPKNYPHPSLPSGPAFRGAQTKTAASF